MIFDNGKEFYGHHAKRLSLDCFFVNPCHSWERGLNEHTNGLIRQFFPKSINFKLVSEKDFQKMVDLINHRLRKSLNYLTLYELLFSLSVLVALHT